MQPSISKSTVPKYQSDILSNRNITHGFFTKNGGVSIGNFASLDCNIRHIESRDAVEQNLNIISNDFSVPYENLKLVNQVHSSEAHIVTSTGESTREINVDALVTNTPNIVIGVYTADCTPIMFASENNDVIGVCHAGWKGAISGVIQDTLDKMQSLGASNISACIGPAIAQKSYEVDSTYRDNFLQHSQDNNQFFIKSSNENHFMFDLKGFCHKTLGDSGVTQIQNLKIDTYSNAEDFFSYRRACHQNEVGVGGQLSALMIKD